MSTSVTWNGTTYSVPASGEVGWAALSNFLIDLGQHAQTTTFGNFTVRKALTTPVTVSASTDFAVVTQLTSPAAVAVNLPAGIAGQIFIICDGTGDAGTNNVTINRNGSDTIAGATTLVLDHNRQVAILGYSSSDTDWKILGKTLPPGTIVNADVSASAAIAYSKLSLGTSIVNADVSTSAAIAGSKLVAAASGVAGAVSTGSQTITGAKIFETGLACNVSPSRSYYNGGNGTGSGNTQVRRFTTAVENVGSDITYAGSATNGDSWTINTAGIYAIAYGDRNNNASTGIAIGRNVTTQGAGGTGTYAYIDTPAAGTQSVTGVTIYLAVNDVIRALNSTSTNNSTNTYCFLEIVKIV